MRGFMTHFNELLMIVIIGLLLGIVQYLVMDPLLSLICNFILIVCFVIYIMQFFGVINKILPSPRLFK